MSARADKAAANDGDQPVKLDIVAIASLFLNMLANPSIEAIFAACKKQPPTPPPVPAALAAAGVTEETWKQANGAKFAAEQSKGNHGFAHSAVNQTAIQIAKEKGIKKNTAKPTAVMALQTGVDETVERIATAMQEAKDNAPSIQATFAATNPDA